MAHSQETLDRLREEQIARLKAERAEFLRLQEEEQQKQLAERRKAEREEQEAVEALQRPVARIWRIGRTVLWEPPETVDQLKPAGYWISEEYKGEWTVHGDYLPPEAREGWLFGDGPCRVEVVYPGYLSRGKPSPIVEQVPGELPALVGAVRSYCTEPNRPDVYYERWRRVLAAFGVVEGKKGHASRPIVWPLDPPMTVEEAQGYVDKGWGHRWEEVLPVLKRLAGKQAEEEKQPEVETCETCGKALLNEDQLRQLFDGRE